MYICIYIGIYIYIHTYEKFLFLIERNKNNYYLLQYIYLLSKKIYIEND
jgi:hypothetical protein